MDHRAALIQKERIKLGDDAFADVVIWAVPQPVHASAHDYKYALAYVIDGQCVYATTLRPAKATTNTYGAWRWPTPSLRSTS